VEALRLSSAIIDAAALLSNSTLALRADTYLQNPAPFVGGICSAACKLRFNIHLKSYLVSP
jgi:hypothetical protein